VRLDCEQAADARVLNRQRDFGAVLWLFAIGGTM
jgi:hypothetical protein